MSHFFSKRRIRYLEKYPRFSSILNFALSRSHSLLGASLFVATSAFRHSWYRSRHSFVPALFLETICYGKLASMLLRFQFLISPNVFSFLFPLQSSSIKIEGLCLVFLSDKMIPLGVEIRFILILHFLPVFHPPYVSFF